MTEAIMAWREWIKNTPLSEKESERLTICGGCTSRKMKKGIYFDKGKLVFGGYPACKECGCPLLALIRAHKSKCKLKKW